MGNPPFEDVSPIKKWWAFPASYVSLPEGILTVKNGSPTQQEGWTHQRFYTTCDEAASENPWERRESHQNVRFQVKKLTYLTRGRQIWCQWLQWFCFFFASMMSLAKCLLKPPNRPNSQMWFWFISSIFILIFWSIPLNVYLCLNN